MYDYVIVHGSYGSPFENWFPWLYSKLEANGKAVLAPQFPCGEKIQCYDIWKRVMDVYKPYIDENTILIGHSLSPAFIVDYLMEEKMVIKKLICAAPFYGMIGIEAFDYVNRTFFYRKEFEGIEDLVKDIVSFVSKNDPYVPNELSLDFAQKIGSKVILVDNAGHFNAAAGYTTFDQLYREL